LIYDDGWGCGYRHSAGLPWVCGSSCGYGDRDFVPTAALDSAVGMGIHTHGSSSSSTVHVVVVWGGYGDTSSVPTAALDIGAKSVGVGWAWRQDTRGWKGMETRFTDL